MGQILPANQTTFWDLRKKDLCQACLSVVCCCTLACVCWPGYILSMAVQLCWFPNPSSLWGQWMFSSFGWLWPWCQCWGEQAWGTPARHWSLKRHCWCLWVYISVPELHFSICSCQWQLLNFLDASSKWVERWQKKLLWFKWVRGQCYSVCLIIYLPSYTQHLAFSGVIQAYHNLLL